MDPLTRFGSCWVGSPADAISALRPRRRPGYSVGVQGAAVKCGRSFRNTAEKLVQGSL